MDDLHASCVRLRADHETQAAHLARMNALMAEGALLAQVSLLSSLPEMARQLQMLTDAVAALQQAVQVLEEQCETSRQNDVLRYWEPSC